jgi:hypothetical protein
MHEPIRFITVHAHDLSCYVGNAIRGTAARLGQQVSVEARMRDHTRTLL